MALKNIFTNSEYLKSVGANQSFGNHLCHLMFCHNFSKKRNYKLNICTDTNLSSIFELDEYKSTWNNNIVNYFSESFVHDIEELKKIDRLNLNKSLNLLNDETLDIPDNISVTGWFYNTPLYSKSFFNDIKIKKDIIDFLNQNFSRVFEKNSISIHYRGTDFNGHLGYDLRLPFEYYEKCIHHMIKNHKNIKNIYVFTDDSFECLKLIDIIKNIDSSFNIELIQNEYYIDWACLHFSKNIISSNSSFCSTACIYDKEICYQPNKYQLRNTPIDGVYPSEPFFKNSYIL